jgi:Glycosyl transferases group 1
MMDRYDKLRVLLVQWEHPTWQLARQWSYGWHLGIEEGLHANGIEFVTLTTTWLSHARKICAAKQFDQVWINDVTHLGNDGEIDEPCLEWLASLAPVRIGFIMETARYSPEEYEAFPNLMRYEHTIRTNMKYATHVVAADERDVDELGSNYKIPAIWLPVPVPERCIADQVSTLPTQGAIFRGAIYGSRAMFLRHPNLENLLAYQVSPENHTIYPTLFDALPMHRYHRGLTRRISRMRSIVLGKSETNVEKMPGYPYMACAERNSPFPAHFLYPLYLHLLRHIRRQSYSMWLKGLQSGCAVINLPSLFKGYSGRVVEGMAAGCPVISWEIPDRPQTRALFGDGVEILLYSNPTQLATQIQRVLSNPGFGQWIAENARRKLKRFHTTETRVRQILTWVKTGASPRYA